MSISYQDVDLSWRSYRAASEAFEYGHLAKASRILRQALIDSQQTQGRVDPLLLHSANNLAERCFSNCDFSGAAALWRVVYEMRSKSLGEDHVDTLATKSRLALALWQTGGMTPKQLSANQT